MRLIRLDKGGGTRIDHGSTTSADLAAALTAIGPGDDHLGGIALIGSPDLGLIGGPDRPAVDAVLVLPRGVIVVYAVVMPNPAVTLHAPLNATWTADGWPLSGPDGAVNPVGEGLISVDRVSRRLQTAGAEPMPVSLILAVGPYAGTITGAPREADQGIAVLHPSVSSLLNAARRLAARDRPCSVDQAKHLIAALAPEVDVPNTAVLSSEGFPDVVPREMATATTTLLTTVPVEPVRRRSPWTRLIPAALTAVAVLAGVFWTLGGERPIPRASAPATPGDRITEVEGTEFLPRASARDADCAAHAHGEVRAWLSTHPCGGLTRGLYEVSVGDRRAAVSIIVVRLADAEQALRFQALVDTNGSGSITDLVRAGRGWDGGPVSFDGAVRASSPEGSRVRVVQAVWLSGSRGLGVVDEEMESLVERALRIPVTGG